MTTIARVKIDSHRILEKLVNVVVINRLIATAMALANGNGLPHRLSAEYGGEGIT